MIISYKWLLDYLPEALPIEELSHILTAIGLEVEAVEPAEAVKGSLKGLLIGQVLTCEKHPNADKLSVTTVNVGSGEPLQIVCGAPNVAAGQRVVVAPVGAMVHPNEGEPFLIKKAKIRGTESQGMICAEDEIGLGESHAGIMVLPEDASVGTAAADYFNIPEADYALHIGLTPNRTDAMSHIGVARDVCAYLTHHKKQQFDVKLPETSVEPATQAGSIQVTVAEPQACQRYMGIQLSNVKVAASPEWLQQRLKAIGLRPINNVVDITNYVLHEYGQPLHAFDAAQIAGNRITVGFLPDGNNFTTLDEKERKLQANDLMIGDDIGGLCIAGVFGGLHSGVTEATTEVFLESAYFDATHVRRTSMRHGLRTDAATHFEKGVDINNLQPALLRAADLLVAHAGATISSSLTDSYPNKLTPATVEVTYDYINRLAGKDYAKDDIKNILLSLGFGIEKDGADELTLTVPTNKADVSQPADIVEEVLRIDGLDNITIPEHLHIALSRPMPNERKLQQKIANSLTGIGFQEIVTNSIVNSKYYPGREDLVRMLNSLSSELDVMRPEMLESGLEVIAYNCNRKNQDLALYEFGKTYRQAEGKYIETRQLALWMTGQLQPASWQGNGISSDLFYAKGLLSKLFTQGGIEKYTVAYEADRITWKYKNETLATLEQVPADKLKIFDIKQDVYYASVYAQVWGKAAAGNAIKYREVPKYPAVQRDLAVVLDKQVAYKDVQEVTRQLQLPSLQHFDLFDVFESEKLGAGKKSYALSYTFQLQDRTLTDAEIEQVMQQLMTAYKNKLQAQIRE